MRPGRPRRRGFTLVELVLVLVLVALLAAMALPNLRRALVRARATEAVSDLHVIRVAVMGYVGDHHRYPADVTRGETPPELVEYLPDGFSFTGERYVLDYDNWADQEGFVGLSVITADPEMGLAMADILGDEAWSGRGRFTWILEWSP